ncbi:MAG: rRNA maturation RNase YbeY [Oscillospiraceae bacterium]|jgi:probable rRNA maturation factor|nr:rRNA maturation RNase YbeY [Oscillospiraceae bacterium]
MRHKIYVKNDAPDKTPRVSAMLIKRIVKTALAYEGVGVSCEVSVLITGDFGIRSINNAFRNIDAPTDVLSFPMYSFTPGAFDPDDGEPDLSSGRLPLGDIILSAEHIMRQAENPVRTPERETAALVVHSVLHLLGYDHAEDDEDPNTVMRLREREILKLCDLGEPEIPA